MSQSDKDCATSNVLIKSSEPITATQLEGDCDFKAYFEDKSQSGGGNIHQLAYVSDKAFVVSYINLNDAVEVIRRENHCISADGVEYQLTAHMCSNHHYDKYVTGSQTETVEEGMDGFTITNLDEEKGAELHKTLADEEKRNTEEVEDREEVRQALKKKKKQNQERKTLNREKFPLGVKNDKEQGKTAKGQEQSKSQNGRSKKKQQNLAKSKLEMDSKTETKRKELEQHQLAKKREEEEKLEAEKQEKEASEKLSKMKKCGRKGSSDIAMKNANQPTKSAADEVWKVGKTKTEQNVTQELDNRKNNNNSHCCNGLGEKYSTPNGARKLDTQTDAATGGRTDDNVQLLDDDDEGDEEYSSAHDEKNDDDTDDSNTDNDVTENENDDDDDDDDHHHHHHGHDDKKNNDDTDNSNTDNDANENDNDDGDNDYKEISKGNQTTLHQESRSHSAKGSSATSDSVRPGLRTVSPVANRSGKAISKQQQQQEVNATTESKSRQARPSVDGISQKGQKNYVEKPKQRRVLKKSEESPLSGKSQGDHNSEKHKDKRNHEPAAAAEHSILLLSLTEHVDEDNRIILHGIPGAISDKENLILYLENWRAGLGPVEEIDFDTEKRRACVTFKDPRVAASCRERGSIDLKGHRVEVTEFKIAPVEISNEEKTEDFEEQENPNSILVEGLPEDIDRDFLEIYFENRRLGGGKIKTLEWDPQSTTAIITFEDQKVAKLFIERKSLTINGRPITIKEVPKKNHEKELENLCSILVEGLNNTIEKGTLELYFEHKNSGGGDIKTIEMLPNSSSAIITFEHPEVAESVLNKKCHTLQRCTLTVRRLPASTETSIHAHHLEPLKVSAEKPPNVPPRSFSIKIRGIEEGKISAQMVGLFFENTRRSGGGKLKNCEPQEDGFVVTFEDPECVDSVMARHAEQPLNLGGSLLHISIVPPQLTFSSLFPNASAFEDDSTSCAIKVSGLSILNNTSNIELIRLFFGNRKRSGGDEKLELVTRDDGEYAVIIYESPEVVSRVLQQHNSKPFTLGNQRISVEVLNPLPLPLLPPGELYPSALLCTGIYSGTTPTEIRNFFEQRLNYAVERLTFCLQPDRVLVQCAVDIDYCNAVRTSRRYPVGPVMVCLERVQVCRSIQIYNCETICKQYLELYIEKLTGGIQVTTEERKDDGCLILHFEESSALPKLLEKPLVIDGKRIQVNMYHECLGLIPPEVDTSNPICLIPPDIPLKVDPDVLEYVSQNLTEIAELEKELDKEYCSVILPQGTYDGKITLTCRLKKTTPDLTKLAKGWGQRCTEKAKQFFENYSSGQVGVLQDFWDMFKVKLMEDTKSGDAKIPRFTLDESAKSVCFVGKRKACCEFELKTKQINAEVEKEMELRKQTVKEKINCLKHHQLALLKSLKFFEMDEKGTEKPAGTGLNVTYDGPYPILTGLGQDVMAKKVKMFEILNLMVSRNYKAPMHIVQLLREQPFLKYLQKILSDNSVNISWEIGSDGITVYGLKDDAVDSGIKIIQNEFICKEIPLDKQTQQSLKHSVWLETKKELKKCSTLIVEEEESVIRLLATSNVAERAIETVSKFLKEYTIREKLVKFRAGVCNILTNQKKFEIDDICAGFKNSFIKIQAQEKGFLISGTEFGLPGAEKKLRQLATTVVVQEREIDMPGMANHFLSGRGNQTLETIQTKYRVYIENAAGVTVESDDDEIQLTERAGARKGYNSSLDGNQTVTTAVIENGVQVRLVDGDIVRCQVDAIVNAANSDLQHIGGIAKSICDAGGLTIQQECNGYVNKGGRVQPGDLFVSQAGKLPCKAVLHVVGPRWQGGNSNEENTLYQAVTNVLETAESYGFTSIALPAISTGIYGFPLNKASKIILEAIQKFAKEGPASLFDIRIIDNAAVSDTVIDNFIRTMKTVYGNKATQQHSAAEAAAAATGSEPNGRGWQSVDQNSPSQKNSKYSDAGDWEVEDDEGRGARRKSIKFTTQSPQAAAGSTGHPLAQPTRKANAFLTPNGLEIKLVKGSIADEKSDVILNTTNQSLQLGNGAVSSTLLKAAGSAMQDEAKQKAPNGLDTKTLLVTSGHALHCKVVYHANCMAWDNAAGQCEESVRSVVGLALAEAAKSNYTSVSFPAIGTGNLKIPHDLVAQWMLEEIEIYSGRNPRSSVTKARIVVYPTDHTTIAAFESELKNPKRCQSSSAATVRESGRTLKGSKKSSGNINIGTEGAAAASAGLNRGPKGWQIKLGSLTVEVSEGDITKEKTDVIVNSTNASLNLSMGKVSHSILREGGSSIQDECNRIIASDGIVDGIAVTSGGQLYCKFIFHIVVNQGHSNWKHKLERCLVEADKRKLSSISFPLLGTGNMGKAASEMAGIMLEALTKFSKSATTLHNVRIAIFEKKMVEEFAEAIHAKLLGSSGFIGKAKEAFSSISSYFGGSGKNPAMEIYDLPKERRCSFDEKVTFRIYAVSSTDIDSAVRELEIHCKETIRVKIIDGFYEEIIRKLKDEQIALIKQLQETYMVQITVDKGNINRIHIRGESENIMDVQDKIFQIFRDMEKAEREEEERKNAEMLYNQVQWHYEDGGVFMPYPPDINLIIERAFQKKDTHAEWEQDDGSFKVDFKLEKEIKVDGGAAPSCTVKRVVTDSQLPSSWVSMKPGEKVIKVKLKSADEEWKKVEALARASAGTVINQIISIERVQHPANYHAYMVKKMQMEKTAKAGVIIERKLWHGTSVDTLDSIESGGFNRGYCGKNAVAYGRGVYFAKDFSYSASNTYSPPDLNGHKHVYLALVLTGEYTQGNSSLIVPPKKPKAISTADSYDSVVDNVQAPTMFVIFHDVHAYPEYLIIFN